MSHDRTLQDSPPKTRQRNLTADADWAFHELGQALSDVSDQNSNASPINRGNRHQRVKSALPRSGRARLERGKSDMGLTNPVERARIVALTMKTQAANDFEEPRYSSDDNNFTSLISFLEKQRDTDNMSSGSQRNTEGSHKSAEGASRIKSSRLSGPRTPEAPSSFVSRGSWGYRPQRPLSTTSNYLPKHKKSNIDHLYDVLEHVEELCKIPEVEEVDDVRSSGVLAQENANFLSQLVSSHPEVPNEADTSPKVEDNGVHEQTPILRQISRQSDTLIPRMRKTNIFSSFTQPAPGSRYYKFLLWRIELRKQMRNLAAAFDGEYVKERLWHSFQNELSMIVVPALSISAFLYYKMNNPVLPIFSTNASISWWILFLLRHYVTLQVSHSWRIDCLSQSFTFD